MAVKSRRLVDLQGSELRAAFTTFKPALRGQRARISGAIFLALTVTAIELIKPWPITWMLDHLIDTEPGKPVAIGPILIFATVALVVPFVHGLVAERLEILVARVSQRKQKLTVHEARSRRWLKKMARMQKCLQ